MKLRFICSRIRSSFLPICLALVSCSAFSEESSKASMTSASERHDSAVCFNPGLYKAGNKLVLNTTVNDGVIGEEYRLRSVVSPLGSTTFRGREVEHSRIEYFSDENGFSQAGDESHFLYYRSDAKALNYFELGRVMFHQPSRFQTQVIAPHREIRLGESGLWNYDQEYSFVLAGDRSPMRERLEFKGVEEVVVPAGVFDACRIVSTTESDDFVVREEVWLSVGSGIELRSLAQIEGHEGVVLIELESATLNGKAIR